MNFLTSNGPTASGRRDDATSTSDCVVEAIDTEEGESRLPLSGEGHLQTVSLV